MAMTNFNFLSEVQYEELRVEVEELSKNFIEELPDRGNILFNEFVKYPRNFLQFNKNFKRVIKNKTADFYVVDLTKLYPQKAIIDLKVNNINRYGSTTVVSWYKNNFDYTLKGNVGNIESIKYEINRKVVLTINHMKQLRLERPNLKFIASYNLCKTFNSGEELTIDKLKQISQIIRNSPTSIARLTVASLVRINLNKYSTYLQAMFDYNYARVTRVKALDNTHVFYTWFTQGMCDWDYKYNTKIVKFQGEVSPEEEDEVNDLRQQLLNIT